MTNWPKAWTFPSVRLDFKSPASVTHIPLRTELLECKSSIKTLVEDGLSRKNHPLRTWVSSLLLQHAWKNPEMCDEDTLDVLDSVTLHQKDPGVQTGSRSDDLGCNHANVTAVTCEATGTTDVCGKWWNPTGIE